MLAHVIHLVRAFTVPPAQGVASTGGVDRDLKGSHGTRWWRIRYTHDRSKCVHSTGAEGIAHKMMCTL